ncbi:MAG TPA: glyoxalase/bleomycin resistance/dioxygenase family protein [Cytophagales bacterium]|nr:glyoxalase/bleomycin resistance/dioxygenase family protein [Cytophagales bacterium]HAA17935.1 glyoxalase/bleomycin resistance/dioxygenase family protein [Cytophagales bacterium]HAP62757.1 glyoxalase/bleomycin resistance/dioxygenase family protein [Cytophagales bacterium]
MSRVHIMLNVENLEGARTFYQNLLGTAPTKVKPDYIQWKLDNPSLNLSMKSNPAHPYGVDHVGLEAAHEEELAMLSSRVEPTPSACCEGGETVCCYAKSDKVWSTDPTGLKWEIFFTHGDHPTYSDQPEKERATADEVHV